MKARYPIMVMSLTGMGVAAYLLLNKKTKNQADELMNDIMENAQTKIRSKIE